MTDISAILKDRGSKYGDFADHAQIVWDLKSVIYRYSPTTLTPSMRESLDMIAHKIGRILNGDPRHADSWVDIAGYAKLVADELQEEPHGND